MTSSRKKKRSKLLYHSKAWKLLILLICAVLLPTCVYGEKTDEEVEAALASPGEGGGEEEGHEEECGGCVAEDCHEKECCETNCNVECVEHDEGWYCLECKSCCYCNEDDPENPYCDVWETPCAEDTEYDPDCNLNLLWKCKNYAGPNNDGDVISIVNRYAQTNIADYDTTTAHSCDNVANNEDYNNMFNYVYSCIYDYDNWQ